MAVNIQHIGYDPDQIRNLNLSQFRNSNLSRNSYLLLLIPVIGWIALGCLKIHYVSKHSSCEKLMNREGFYTTQDINRKIQIVSRVINVSGPLEWQYRLERARLCLLNNQFNQAAEDMNFCQKQRDWFNGFIDCPPVRSHKPYFYNHYSLKIEYQTSVEASLHAAIFSANEQYEQAYDAYNQAMVLGIFSPHQVPFHARGHQLAVLEALRNNVIIDTTRKRAIIRAESN